MALHLNPSRIKDLGVKGEIGRVRIIRGPDIPNVPGKKVEVCDMQRFGRILIHIGDIGIFNFKFVDLDGIKRIDGLAPSFLLDGHFLLQFLLRLRQGDVEDRTADQIIADQHPREDLTPLNAEDPAGNLRDRRIGMVRLNHGQLLDFERQ